MISHAIRVPNEKVKNRTNTVRRAETDKLLIIMNIIMKWLMFYYYSSTKNNDAITDGSGP